MAKTFSTMPALGMRAPSFTLPDTNSGRVLSLQDFHDSQALLVMFICNHCPYVVHVRDTLVGLCREFQRKGVAVVAISSNDPLQYPEDGPDEMKTHALQHGFSFPYLFDESQNVAKAYQAACTPDFYLFDHDRTLVYRGQMDDSRPGNGKVVDGHDLKTAVENVLTGKRPAAEQKPSMGCNIKWR